MKKIGYYPGLWQLAIFAIVLVAARIFVTQSVSYGFLIFNLVLAAVPFLISGVLREMQPLKPLTLLAATLLWLGFLPNAPYLVTDFLHFRHQNGQVPAWYDMLMLFTCAVTGFAFGVVSLLQMAAVWERKFGARRTAIIALVVCLASGFGIYIGRFLRYNTWDVLHHPARLVTDVVPALTDASAITFSVGFGLLFFLTFRLFSPHHYTLEIN